jgi:Amt family ammonium transporter
MKGLGMSVGKYQGRYGPIVLGGMLALGAQTAVAQEATEATITFSVGNLWLLIATCLVFMMHLGFATLEAGLSQQKNTVNILFKNVVVIAIGILTYALVGFNLMYPGADFAGGVFGFAGFGIGTGPEGLTTAYSAGYTYWTDFIFQAVFAATTATIVSGAVAERIKVSTFVIFSVLFVALCYPIIGMWKWGGGFLDAMDIPFYDFAGSTLVHSVGGWGALAGALLLGPRLGKYMTNGQVNQIYPHSMPLATMGMFLLWFGWFGFNGGSVLSADPGAVSRVFVTTAIAGAAGIVGAMIATKIMMKHMDLTMILNGALAGLVGITAGADQMGPMSAAMIGLIAGLIVVFSVLGFDRLRVDDPVGAISVHLVCGIWGTLAVGLFGDLASPAQFMSQLIGVLSVGAFAFGFAYLVFSVLKALGGIRVSAEIEKVGLDHSEHGLSAYRGLYLMMKRESEEEAAIARARDKEEAPQKGVAYI